MINISWVDGIPSASERTKILRKIKSIRPFSNHTKKGPISLHTMLCPPSFAAHIWPDLASWPPVEFDVVRAMDWGTERPTRASWVEKEHESVLYTGECSRECSHTISKIFVYVAELADALLQ